MAESQLDLKNKEIQDQARRLQLLALAKSYGDLSEVMSPDQMQSILKSYEQSEKASKVDREQLYAAKAAHIRLQE